MSGFGTRATNFTFTKDIPIKERMSAQIRFEMMNAFHNYNFDPPTTTVDLLNPRTFGKVRTDPRTSSLGGEPLLDLQVLIRF